MKHLKLFEGERQSYTWDELSPEAKAHALDNNRDINVEGNWYEDTIEYWEDKLKEAGIITPDIRFTGFGSQGDGASFTGEVSGLESLKTMMKTLELEYPDIVLEELDIQIVRIASRYYHHKTVEVEVIYEEDGTISYMPFGPEIPFDYNLNEVASKIQEKLQKWVELKCHEIYDDLSLEYDSLTDDEAVEDSLIANDYEYDEDGNII